MPTLKVRCPECDANIRKSVDEVEDTTQVDLTCPKCGCEFATEMAPTKPAKAAKPAKKPAKPSRRADDDDDDHEHDRPRKKKRKPAAAGPNMKVIGGIAAGLLAVAGIVGAVIAFGGKDKDTSKDTADNTPPANVNPTGPGMPGPIVPPGSGTVTPPGGGTVTPSGGGTVPGPGAGTNPNPPPKQNPPKINPPKQDPPPKKEPDDDLPPGITLPPPPVIRISGSLAPPKSTPVARPPAVPPLEADEDPFVRAKAFRPDSLPPPLPKLPPVSQRPVLTLDPGGHSQFVINSFITPKGDRVITVSMDKAVRIWDARTGDVLDTLRLPAGPGEDGALQAAALAPNGKRLAVAGKPVKAAKGLTTVPIFVINVETATLFKSFNAGKAPITALDFSGDGKQLVAGCEDGVARLFDVNTGRQVDQVQAHEGQIVDVRFNPKSRMLATLGPVARGNRLEMGVRVWNLTNSSQNATVSSASHVPLTIAWSPDGQTFAAAGESGEITLFGVNAKPTGNLPARVHEGETVKIRRMRFLSAGEIACCGVGGRARGWAGVIDVATGRTKTACTLHTNSVEALGVAADGGRVVSSGGNQHESYVWDAATGRTVSRLCGRGNGIWGVGWAKDGKSLAYGTSNVRNADDTRPLDFLFRFDDFGASGVPDESKYEQATKSDGTYAWARIGENELAIGPVNGRPTRFRMPDQEKIYGATVVPHRRLVAVASALALVLVDAETGKVVRTLVGHSGNVLGVAASPDGKYVVSCGSDQTIRVWRPDDEDPLLSIFIAGKDWIAWTPEGFYACSAQGERLIAWQVNAGSTKFPAVHPAERFRSSLYQPALIKYLIPAGKMQLALAMATKFDKALVQTTNIADIIPPEVVLDYPTPPDPGKEDAAIVVVDDAKITVKASAKSAKHPVTAMRLLVDGRPFEGSAGVRRFDNPQASAEATWEVPLTPGPHSFAVIAETPVSKGMSRVSTLARSGEPPKPNLYVLAVGIAEYPGANRLNYCASDARMLAKAFQSKSQAVFADIEVRVLTDADATRKGIREGMDWLKSKMTAKDVGIVSFSGHGMRDPFTGKFYLVPVDLNDKDPVGTAFSGDEFKNRLENMPGRLVAILDACHSGTVAEKMRPPVRTDGLVRDLVAEDSGVIVMCASLGREYAIESNLTKAGFYTLGLVEGMGGHGDVDQDGIIYIHELDLYAGARVRQLSGGMQNPTLGRPPGIRPFPIAKP
jgi:WD40 repeat protein